MQQRIEYFDFLRGVAILMVVAIHCFGASIGKRIGLNGNLKWFCLTIIVILASFFVLFISKKLFPKATRILLGV